MFAIINAIRFCQFGGLHSFMAPGFAVRGSLHCVQGASGTFFREPTKKREAVLEIDHYPRSLADASPTSGIRAVGVRLYRRIIIAILAGVQLEGVLFQSQARSGTLYFAASYRSSDLRPGHRPHLPGKRKLC